MMMLSVVLLYVWCFKATNILKETYKDIVSVKIQGRFLSAPIHSVLTDVCDSLFDQRYLSCQRFHTGYKVNRK